MEKVKQYKTLIIIALIIVSFVFYWTQMRSVVIKKNCSMYTEVIPADTGITKEQADLNKKTFDEQCTTNKLINFQCFQLKNNSQERLPKEETRETRDATKAEYDKCLRQNGL